MSKSLVIVESPAKARTIARFLGKSYVIKASLGHVRDLPENQLGVDVKQDFAPKYQVPKEKRKLLQEIKEAAQGSTSIYLATDPDREGEAISWHLMEAADLDQGRVKRVVFHEITGPAVKEAFSHPRDIDLKLVNAQQARRILDRLVGYKLSPLLWQKIQPKLSAGRVQSTALRMVVEREREIEAFVPQEFWTITALLDKVSEGGSPFKAQLHGVAGAKDKLEISRQEEGERIREELEGASYIVAKVAKRRVLRRPAPPFTTSTLQQEAWRKLGFPARKTMLLAQQLYEGIPLGPEGSVGLITYMRTDSTQVSQLALNEAREYINAKFGGKFLPKTPRIFARKSRLAQEAHEAVRPTSIGREPQSLARFLNKDQRALYELIWKRMVASQMADASLMNTGVDINARSSRSGSIYLFKARGSTVQFPGFLSIYTEGHDVEPEEETALPDLKDGEPLNSLGLDLQQHFTKPPPWYNEASLIKALEENGIGRPSTYAPTLATIQERKYVQRDNGRLKPLPLGFLVSDLLTQNFPEVIDLGFTAQMEEEFDEIARGKRPWVKVIENFYAPFSKDLEKATTAIPDEAIDQVCDRCGRPMMVKVSRRYGKRFLSCSGYPECDNAKPIPGEQKPIEITEEQCSICGKPMAIKTGRFGRFLACTGFPQCRNAKPLLQPTGAHCPECGGNLVERRSRQGRRFYGCSNYPTCNFTTRSTPLPQECPECGGLLVASGRQGERCLKCAYKGLRQVETVPVEA